MLEENNKSEVARLVRDIQMHNESAKWGLEGTAIKAPHEFITKQMENMWTSFQQLQKEVGQDAAFALLLNESKTEKGEPAMQKSNDFPDTERLEKTAPVLLSQFLHYLLREAIHVLPPSTDVSFLSRGLDVACGSGAWVREAALLYPEIHFVGIDKNPYVMRYAVDCAARVNLANAHFAVVDMYESFPFPPLHFDLIRLCFLTPALFTTSVLGLLEQLSTLLFGSGKLFWIEPTIPITNSPALSTFLQYIQQALDQLGTGMYRAGDMEELLKKASFHNIEHMDTEITFSARTRANQLVQEHILFLLAAYQPMFKRMQIATTSELQTLSGQISQDISSPTFTGFCTFTTVIAEKPFPDKA